VVKPKWRKSHMIMGSAKKFQYDTADKNMVHTSILNIEPLKQWLDDRRLSEVPNVASGSKWSLRTILEVSKDGAISIPRPAWEVDASPLIKWHWPPIMLSLYSEEWWSSTLSWENPSLSWFFTSSNINLWISVRLKYASAGGNQSKLS